MSRVRCSCALSWRAGGEPAGAATWLGAGGAAVAAGAAGPRVSVARSGAAALQSERHRASPDNGRARRTAGMGGRFSWAERGGGTESSCTGPLVSRRSARPVPPAGRARIKLWQCLSVPQRPEACPSARACLMDPVVSRPQLAVTGVAVASEAGPPEPVSVEALSLTSAPDALGPASGEAALARPNAASLIGQTLSGRYLVTALIGSGGTDRKSVV